MDQAAAIPFTAWQQAVFVALFVFMVLGILAWVGHENSKRDTFQASESEKWRKFLKEQKETDEKTSKAVTESIGALTEVITNLVQEVRMGRSDFQAHDAMERAKLEEMSKKIHEEKPTTPRKGRNA